MASLRLRQGSSMEEKSSGVHTSDRQGFDTVTVMGALVPVTPPA